MNCSGGRKFFSFLINDKVSIKTQLELSFALITILAGGLTLAICLGLLAQNADSAYTVAKGTVLSQTRESVSTVSKEIGNSLEQQLSLLGESVCMMSAMYASVLLQYSDTSTQGTLLAPRPSFKEYNFKSPCAYPECPTDFNRATNISLGHSSVYLFSNRLSVAARDDATWSTVVGGNPYIMPVVNGLVYQDIDLDVMFNKGPNITLMFYLTTSVFSDLYPTAASANNYDVIHRTFPGASRTTTAYNPTRRDWYVNAPVDAFAFSGPYLETFSNEPVFTLSSKKVVSTQKTTVSAAVILISEFSKIVNNIEYTNDGFGAVIRSDNHQVIVWDDEEVYDRSASTFKTVSYFDSVLDLLLVSTNDQYIIDYTDSEGADWTVSVVSILPTLSFSLQLLVFSKRSLTEYPVKSLKSSIDDTSSNVTIDSVVIVMCTVGGVMILVYFLVMYITHPLTSMIDISKEIVLMSAEDEVYKDYSDILRRSYENTTRSDEVGQIAQDYYSIVYMLHKKNVEKRSVPKFPVNPFYCPATDSYATHHASGWDWRTFMAMLTDHKGPELDVQAELVDAPTVVPDDGDLDVLSSMPSMRELKQSSLASASRVQPMKPTSNGVFGGMLTKSVKFTAVATEETQRDSDAALKYAASSHVEEDVELGESGKGDENIIELSPSGIRTMTMSSEQDSKRFVPTTAYVAEPQSTGPVTVMGSLKSQLYALCGLLLAGLIATLIVTLFKLKTEGTVWIDNSKEDLMFLQLQNLVTITENKAAYVESYFEQLALDLLSGSQYFAELLDGNLTRPGFDTAGQYLPSYAMDTNNPYAASVARSYDFSSYFLASDANCQNSNTCNVVHDSNQSKLLSLIDLKMRSYYHSANVGAFSQIAVESNGYTKYFPYAQSTTNSNPTTCLIGDRTAPYCEFSYSHSACTPGYVFPVNPAYDARCRPWYQLAARGATTSSVPQVYFQNPKKATNGDYVVASVVPVMLHGEFIGVWNGNYLANTLSESINSLSILDSGYVYLIDTKNSSVLILHPRARTSCSRVECAEDFTTEEYKIFRETVLEPLQQHDYANIPTQYSKRGKTWQLQTAPVTYGTVSYTLLATVPLSEIIEASQDIETSISRTSTSMIVAFAFCITFFACILGYFAYELVTSIVTPLNDLHALLAQVKADDLAGQIPTEASSLDMKLLLEAFSKFIVSLRFGSESYARGDQSRAHQVFRDALELYTTTNNKRGIGASLNNLAAVELSLGNFRKSQELNKEAILIAQEMLEDAKSSYDIALGTIERVLSDRQGNLAVAYLEENNFGAAFEILERMLIEDRNNGYIRGCVVKQGTLGQYYLKQGEIKSAEKVFQSALDFVRKQQKDAIAQGAIVDRDEFATAEQIALYNVALIRDAQRAIDSALVRRVLASEVENTEAFDMETYSAAVAESAFIETLVMTPTIHAATVTKTLISLRAFFQAQHRMEDVAQLDALAAEHLFNISLKHSKTNTRSDEVKHVAFVIDFSGSMSGSKIRSAVENVDSMFKNHINDQDSMMLVKFNKYVTMVMALTKKKGNEALITRCIESLEKPTGSTAYYDAIQTTLQEMSTNMCGNDWIVLLTDGEDNASTATSETITALLSQSKVGLIILGVGMDVQAESLETLTKASHKGVYISVAQGDKQSIDEAFGKVASLIHGLIILEDM